jgi:hypothetical protein
MGDHAVLERRSVLPGPILYSGSSVPPAFRAEQGFYDLIHILRIHSSRLRLRIYVEANGEEEVLVVATSSVSDPRRAEWIAPAPRWTDA